MDDLYERGRAAITRLCKLDKTFNAAQVLRYYGAERLSQIAHSKLEPTVLALEGLVSLLDSPTEKPKMAMIMEDAILIARYGRVKNHPARKARYLEAREVCLKRAEELMLRAERNYTPPTLVDVLIYDNLPYMHDKMWVKRCFNDGSATKSLEDRGFAKQLQHTFLEGRKAGAKGL